MQKLDLRQKKGSTTVIALIQSSLSAEVKCELAARLNENYIPPVTYKGVGVRSQID